MNTRRKLKQYCKKLIEIWRKYSPADDQHEQWLVDNCSLLDLRRGDVLDRPKGKSNHRFYIIIEGMIAWVQYDAQHRKRKILGTALPEMAIQSSRHLYSNSPLEGELIALRKSKVLAIPYTTLKEANCQDLCLNIFLNALQNKSTKQLRILREISMITQPLFKRYQYFLEKLPELMILKMQERADLLSISRSTLNRLSNPKYLRKLTEKSSNNEATNQKCSPEL